MFSKGFLLLLAGFVFGGILVFWFRPSPLVEPRWVEELEALGLIDRMGNPEAETRFLVVTSFDCEPCLKTMEMVFPLISEPLLDGRIGLTMITILPNTEVNRTILETKKRSRDLDPDLLVLLNEYLVHDYRTLASDPSVTPDVILERIGVQRDSYPSNINWSDKIESSFPILEKAGVATVPLWFHNLKRLKGSSQDILNKVDAAIEALPSKKESVHP